MIGRPYQMSKCDREALPEVRQWSVGPPKSRGAVRGRSRGLEVVGRPS